MEGRKEGDNEGRTGYRRKDEMLKKGRGIDGRKERDIGGKTEG